MVKTVTAGDRLRQRLRSERERRSWTMAELAAMLTERGVTVWPSTIAKIESGDRAVQVAELNVFADLFGTSIDALVGRNSAGSDLAWTVSKLTATAQKLASEVTGLHGRLQSELDDVHYYAEFSPTGVAEISKQTREALDSLFDAQVRLQKLAGQFPLPR